MIYLQKSFTVPAAPEKTTACEALRVRTRTSFRFLEIFVQEN
jgi:hypothetical protein